MALAEERSPPDGFRKPAAPAPRRPKKVLDEDAFTQELEDIIERDFFPDLPKLKAQIEYQRALEENDVPKLRQLQLKYGPKLRRPGSVASSYASPSSFETPVTSGSLTPSQNDPNPVGADVGTPAPAPDAPEQDDRAPSVGLDDYLAGHTSEDNASFGLIMEESARKHRMKFAWLYDKESEHAKFQKLALALPSAEDQAGDCHRVPCIDTWSYTNKNSLMYVPEGAELTAEETFELERKRRVIVHGNTHFERSPFNEQVNRIAISEAAHNQARAKEGKIGVDGKELVPSETPEVAGYGFVATPSPVPGVDATPLMTWGEIAGTPFRLDGSDTPRANTPGPTFRIQDVPARDKLAMELAEKAGLKHREKKMKALLTVQANLCSPSPYATQTDRLASMSAAAQRLASSRLGIHVGRDLALRQSYTPSPKGRRMASGTPRSARRPGAVGTPNTPTVDGTPKDAAATPKVASLTDNLLNLPKRARAADYFVT